MFKTILNKVLRTSTWTRFKMMIQENYKFSSNNLLTKIKLSLFESVYVHQLRSIMESLTDLAHIVDSKKRAREDVPVKAVPRPKCDPPYGMEPYDSPGVSDNLGALSDLQQEELNNYKGQLMQEDEDYLRQHPEISCMVKNFMVQVIQQKPVDIDAFARDYFTNHALPDNIAKLFEEHESHKKLNIILRNSFLDL